MRAAFMYRLQGAGTRALAGMRAGETVDAVGPLGNGFEILPGKSAIIGGGIGVFPLLLLARRLCANGAAPDVFAGFQNAESVVLSDEFKPFADNITLVSDDGSTGMKAFVTEAFLCALSGGAAYDNVYACGPVPMLKTLAGICETRAIKAQFTLEQRMGCGIGACLVCACAVKSNAANGHEASVYVRVCRDGPVFASDELIFEDL
jgi:dihydroorotate dehydrogenase electron transfer subunit